MRTPASFTKVAPGQQMPMEVGRREPRLRIAVDLVVEARITV